MEINDFIKELSSKTPVPGGGGASALIAAVGCALCSMAACLTVGKKNYKLYADDIDGAIDKAQASAKRLLTLIEKDAEVFEPLSKAYSIPKDSPGRDDIMEEALRLASGVPMEILGVAEGIIETLETLFEKAATLVISDVGVAASALRCGCEGAAMNVYINAKYMKDRVYAQSLIMQAETALSGIASRCGRIYDLISERLKK